MQKLPLLAAIFALAPLPSIANPAIVQDFRAQAQVIPQRLMAAGQRRFGALDLGDLLNRQSRVQVSVVGQVDHSRPIGPFDSERDGAEWSEGRVAVSAKTWPRVRGAAKPMLALHEMLGALRIEDTDFGCSGSLWVLSDSNARATMSREELATFESFAERGCYVARSGGSTGVTGGGDDYNVNIRINGMNKALAEMKRARSQAERNNAFTGITSSFYGTYGRSKKKSSREKILNFSLNETPLPSGHDPATIRVYTDSSLSELMPQSAINGWTYNAKTNTVQIHGRYRKGKFGEGPAVISSPQR